MLVQLKWVLVINLTIAHISRAQEPRKKSLSSILYEDSEQVLDKTDEVDVSCSVKTCFKRSAGQDVGPFWANRGKKDSLYYQDPFYADEPHWLLVQKEPLNPGFYVAKDEDEELRDDDYSWKTFAKARLKGKRKTAESPFFAARGRKRHLKFE